MLKPRLIQDALPEVCESQPSRINYAQVLLCLGMTNTIKLLHFRLTIILNICGQSVDILQLIKANYMELEVMLTLNFSLFYLCVCSCTS